MVPISILLILIALVLLLQPRRFYFVRHGQTVQNVQHIKQGPEGDLTDKGRAQAAKVAELLRPYGISKIISSTYPRSLETSGIICEILKIPLITSDLFAERKSPSEVLGKSTHDPLVVDIVNRTELAYHEDDYRYSDEENFVDLKVRARKALNLLASQGGDGTCIVTHRSFLKMLIAYALYRERLHAADFVKLSFFNWSDNAGITICEFSPFLLFSPTRGWRVISYNQQPPE